MKSIILAFLISYSGCCVTAQVPNITDQKIVDSLFNQLPGKSGTSKADLLNQISLQLGPRSFDSSFRYASDALTLSRKIGYTKGEGVALFNIGNCYYFILDIKHSLSNYLASLSILEHFEPCSELADLLSQLAILNHYVRNSQKAHVYFLHSASNYHTINDLYNEDRVLIKLSLSFIWEIQMLKSIGSVSETTNNRLVDSALKYNNICLDHYQKRWNDPRMLAEIYMDHGLFLMNKGGDGVLDYYQKALDASEKIKDSYTRKMQQGIIYMNTGFYYYICRNDVINGYINSLKSSELLALTDRYDLYSTTLADLGEMEMTLGNYSKARQLLYKALAQSELFLSKKGNIRHTDPTFRLWGIKQVQSWRIIIFNDLVKFYERTGDYRKALEFQKKTGEEKALMIQDELARQVIGTEAENEDNIKRQQIDQLIRDNDLRTIKLNRARLFFGGVGGFLLVILLIILYWLQRKRFISDHKALVLEQKLLRSQMNPHFLFNALTGIQNFILTQKPDQASIYLSKFANLVRNILDNSVEEFVTLEKEISTIENYLELQKVRYAGKFEYRITVADAIDPEELMIPPMLAQPFIENSIEHGIKHRETPGHLDIRFSLQDHTLVFEVEDDGVGRQKAREISIQSEPAHRSMATSLTRDRLATLNRKLRKKIILEITDLKNALGEAGGTRVMFAIPLSL